MSETELPGRDEAELIWPLADYHRFACHEDPAVRSWALGRAALLRPELAQATLVRALRDSAPRVVMTALELLEQIDPVPLDALRELLRRTKPGDARHGSALRLLADSGDAEAAAQLEEERGVRRRTLGAPPESEAPADSWAREGYEGEEPPRAITEEEALRLRPRALARLGRADLDENMELLSALGRCRWRWASTLLAERFEDLLASEADEAAWVCAAELGDPSLLDAALRGWRKGEPAIAESAVFLARLGGRLRDLPSELRQEAKLRRRRLASLGPQPWLDPARPLILQLRCHDCRRAWHHDVERVFVDPKQLKRSGSRRRAPGEWDGCLLGRVVVCKSCGAVDEYELTSSSSLRLVAEVVAQSVSGAEVDVDSDRLVLARTVLWDGTILRRPMRGIEHLRRLAEAEPDVGERWRRLGNLCERFGMLDEAEESWRRAVLDPAEGEAAYSLAMKLMDDGELPEAVAFSLEALRRMHSGDFTPALRAGAAANLCDLLARQASFFRPPVALLAGWPGERTGREVQFHVSAVDLRRIQDWDRLGELIGGGFFTSLSFSSELPENEDSQLLDLIDGPLLWPPPLPPVVRAAPKVRRNDPCPCGSGRKHKRCCM